MGNKQKPNGRTGRVAGFLLAALACGSALAGQPYVPIEQRLSAEQMRATGLDQLRWEQLSLLNQLLREQQDNVAAAVAAQRGHKKRDAAEVVTSTLKGEFHGWESGTVLELSNGQRWRVIGTEYYTTQRTPNTKVTIAPGVFGGWFLQVDGMNAGTKVKRIEP